VADCIDGADQRAGAGGAGAGRCGSRDGSGLTSGGGAGIGASTGSTVIVFDGPSSEPRGWDFRGEVGSILRKSFMAAPPADRVAVQDFRSALPQSFAPRAPVVHGYTPQGVWPVTAGGNSQHFLAQA
jgi:hypothetical protein